MMKEIGVFSETLGDLNHMMWLPAQEDLITSSGTGYTNDKFQCNCFTTIKHLNPINAELNPICRLLALLGAHHILHVSRIRVNIQSRSKKKWGNWSNWRKYIIL
jgi:hypothetical protein